MGPEERQQNEIGQGFKRTVVRLRETSRRVETLSAKVLNQPLSAAKNIQEIWKPLRPRFPTIVRCEKNIQETGNPFGQGLKPTIVRCEKHPGELKPFRPRFKPNHFSLQEIHPALVPSLFFPHETWMQYIRSSRGENCTLTFGEEITWN